jgi:hypothetical protein
MKVPNIQSYDEFSVQFMFYNRPKPIGKCRQAFLRKAIRQSYPFTDLDRPLSFGEFEAPTISWKPAHEGVEVVISAHRPPLPSGNISGTHLTKKFLVWIKKQFIFRRVSQNCETSLLASLCLSVRPTVRMEQLGFHWTDFHEIWHLSIFR